MRENPMSVAHTGREKPNYLYLILRSRASAFVNHHSPPVSARSTQFPPINYRPSNHCTATRVVYSLFLLIRERARSEYSLRNPRNE